VAGRQGLSRKDVLADSPDREEPRAAGGAGLLLRQRGRGLLAKLSLQSKPIQEPYSHARHHRRRRRPRKQPQKHLAEGPIKEILKNRASLTGQFLSGRRHIALPHERRTPNGHNLFIRGARHNNLKNIDVKLPLGLFICITGASGSGKSTLVHEILYKQLYALYHDSRTLPGEHDALEGFEHISDVINIDQNPIGRSPRSNPATYIGFYDNIRKLFASTPEARARGYTASRFSFNMKGGRCEECRGEGTITTKLHFMPDVVVPCPTCKGARYNEETLEITYEDRNISEVLEMSIEEGVEFFAGHNLIAHKLGVLDDLGLGYLQIGHPAPILSGGEAHHTNKRRDFEMSILKLYHSNLRYYGIEDYSWEECSTTIAYRS
jgi:excinuclease ABC A subunit